MKKHKTSLKDQIIKNRYDIVTSEDKKDYSGLPETHIPLEIAKDNGKLTAYDLKSPEVVDSAYKSLVNILNGKPFGSVEKIEAKQVMDAIKLVYDRVDPEIKRNLNLSVKQNSFIDRTEIVDLDKFRKKEM